MISQEKSRNALRVIHDIIILARKMAYDKVDHKKIASVLDDLEHLPMLILDENDRTEDFRKYVEGFGEDYGWTGLVDLFDKQL